MANVSGLAKLTLSLTLTMAVPSVHNYLVVTDADVN